MTRFRTTIAGAATAVLAAGLLAPAAFGGDGDHGTGEGAGGAKSKIVIKSLKTTGMSGKVTSKEGKCTKDRRVQLFRLDDFISVKLDIIFTDNHGNWRSKKDLEPGTYFAKVDSIPGCRYDVSDYEKLRP
jgi:hypothetical protein